MSSCSQSESFSNFHNNSSVALLCGQELFFSKSHWRSLIFSSTIILLLFCNYKWLITRGCWNFNNYMRCINFIIWFVADVLNHHLYQFTQMPGNFYRRALFQRTAVVSFTFSNLIVVLFCIGLSVGVTIAILILLYYQVQFIILGITNLWKKSLLTKS